MGGRGGGRGVGGHAFRSHICADVSGSGLVEVVRFPWRRPHHSMVDTEQRRVLLEAYLSMLFTHNGALQTHPRTIQFLTQTDAADPSMVSFCANFVPRARRR